MKDTESVHKKVQELCDCFATADPLKEMSDVQNDADQDEAALKWLALAALHGVNHNAKKISVSRSDDGAVRVNAEYRKTELPTPGPDIGQKIIQAVRDITHLEGTEGKTALALGIRDSGLNLKVKLKSKGSKEKVTIEFPE
jgi:hypothetical protein